MFPIFKFSSHLWELFLCRLKAADFYQLAFAVAFNFTASGWLKDEDDGQVYILKPIFELHLPVQSFIFFSVWLRENRY